MDAFEEMKENLRQIIAIQAESAKEIAALKAQNEKELSALRAENEKELAALKAEEEKRQEERNAELAALNAELAALKAESEKERIEMRKSLKSAGQKLGSIGINTGAFAEELFYTSLKSNPVLGDQTYDIVLRNVYDLNGSTEYDILMHNGAATAIVEVKYKAHISDIQDLFNKKATAFRKGFTWFGHHKLYLGLASTIISAEIIDAAREAGIFLLGQKGDSYEVVNETVRSF